jgi:lipopolysaccharide transport system ATP-binding protein
MDPIIKVEGLYKKFCRSLKRSMYYGTLDMTRDMFGFPRTADILRKTEFWALQDINLELRQGETLGLIGQNGCGKTTLLRLLNGIFPPDQGKITISGRIGALIAVGAGFHPHMTGRENIFLNGAILGISRGDIKQKFAEIVEFAELGEFIDAPVATYSSGMAVRLGFAIAIHAQIGILLVDEILAVGDAGFQLKCYKKIGELRKEGIGTVLVSHNMHLISIYSDKVVVLDSGKIKFFGYSNEGISIYNSISAKSFQIYEDIEKVNNGTEDFIVKEVIFNPGLEKNKVQLKEMQDLEIKISYFAKRDFENIEIDIAMDLNFPVPRYFQVSNRALNKIINIDRGEGCIIIKINKLNFNNMQFELAFAIWENQKTNILIWWQKIPVYQEGISLSSGWGIFKMDYTIN